MKKHMLFSLSMCAVLILSGCGYQHRDNKEVTLSLPREFNLINLMHKDLMYLCQCIVQCINRS